MEIKVDGRLLVSTLCEHFKEEFGGTLRVYHGQKRLTGAEKVSEIATKTGSYECRGSKTVGGFEKDMMSNFGLKVQVASADDWVLALDEMTLAKLPEIPKNAKIADMDALKAKYARKRKTESTDNDSIHSTRRYTINITTKGTFTPEIFSLEDYDTPETFEEAQAIIEEQGMGEIPICNAMGEDFGGNDFELTVTDEDGNDVYTCEDFDDHFGTSKKIMEDGEEWYDDDDEFDAIVEAHNKAAEKKDTFELGLYLVKIMRDHWGGATYELESDTFEPDKLRFVDMGEFEDMYFGDDTTDLDHLTYDKQYLEKNDDFTPPDVYWEELYIYEKKDGWWEEVCKLEEE